jgi:hypothetical protein
MSAQSPVAKGKKAPGEFEEVAGAPCPGASQCNEPYDFTSFTVSIFWRGILPSGTWEASMPEFEIRILRGDGSTALIAAASYASDFDATHSARKIARDRAFEVWHGMNCVYRTRRFKFVSTPAPSSPDRSPAA